jgi:ADP-ribosyl-[dinitrogen reductase] hydrolase
LKNTITTDLPLDPVDITHWHRLAATGAMIGSAVGDALGAPFEFREAGLYSATFPAPVLGGRTEMIGGGAFGWSPAEFTDDTQMALALAEALLVAGGQFDPEEIWSWFRAWVATANDVGTTTSAALASDRHEGAAAAAHQLIGRTGSNGSVMRIAPIGVAGVLWGREETARVAKAQSDLTHFDPIAGWSAVVAAEVIRGLIVGVTFETALASGLDLVADPACAAELSRVCSPEWSPTDDPEVSNGAALKCLGQAVWAVRGATSFSEAVVAAIDLGGDTDTVAAVAGAMAGARFGRQDIPARWTTHLNGMLTAPVTDGNGSHERTYGVHTIAERAVLLLGGWPKGRTVNESPIPPREVHHLGVLASNAAGAPEVDAETGVISLCRMDDDLAHVANRREFYVLDDDDRNPRLDSVVCEAVRSIETWLAEGRRVLVHCHGGRSRTGFILKAWYMHRFDTTHTAAHEWLESVWPHYVTWTQDFWDHLDTWSGEVCK